MKMKMPMKKDKDSKDMKMVKPGAMKKMKPMKKSGRGK